MGGSLPGTQMIPGIQSREVLNHHRLRRYPLLYHPHPKTSPDRPQLSLIGVLFWDKGGIEVGILEVYEFRFFIQRVPPIPPATRGSGSPAPKTPPGPAKTPPKNPAKTPADMPSASKTPTRAVGKACPTAPDSGASAKPPTQAALSSVSCLGFQEKLWNKQLKAHMCCVYAEAPFPRL